MPWANSGPGLIETMRARGGRLPFLRRHLARLERSFIALGLRVPAEDVVAMAVVAAHAGGGGGRAGVPVERVVRLEIIDGGAEVTTRELPPAEPASVIVATERHAPYPHKTTDRGLFERALAEARAAGAQDALLVTPAGYVAEGTTWSLFWWEGDRLYTPALDLGILPGVGRSRVMELAEVEEVRVPIDEFSPRGMFLVNAVRGIVPIGAFRGRDVPLDGRTPELSRAFWPG